MKPIKPAYTPTQPFVRVHPTPPTLTPDEEQTLKTLEAEVNRKIDELNAFKARVGLTHPA